MAITKKVYGNMPDGREAYLFTLTNQNGLKTEITNFGGIVVSLDVPNKEGKFDDIVLGLDKLEDYLKGHPCFGALVGRHANRIEDAEFKLNGTTYKLLKNDGENHLHGGEIGFDKVLWDAQIIDKDNNECLELKYTSVDGEEGYPGNLDVTVIYSLTNENELKIEYFAQTDKDTVINLTNHSYFNLTSHDAGNISEHVLTIHADRFTAINDCCVPTGEIREVKDTVMDFTKPKKVGLGLCSEDKQIQFGNGYDHNWILNDCGDKLGKAGEVYDSKSGRIMEVYTTKPGMQLYTSNGLDGFNGKGGAIYKKNYALCLETQYFPNALKHKHFPSPILKAGEKYNHTTIYKFSVME